MKPNLFTALIAATATLTGLISKVETASAADFNWNSSWTQSTIYNKSQTGFNDTPFQQFVQAESVALPNSGQFKLDPNKLNLKYDHDVSVYFINEGAGYRNQLAFESTGTTNKSGLLFNDISCQGNGCVSGDWGGNALKLGDGVKVGNVTAGTQLDFWLRADGLIRGNSANIFGTDTASNADGLQHAVAYAYNNYILLAFEDLYGGLHASGVDSATGKWNEGSDRDFNDVVVVLDIGEANVKALIGATVPEPSVTLSMFAVGAVGMFGLRRRRQSRTSN
ncbi:PEP-CTERM domain protein [Nostoc punctiforme NIES-2108]|uniref:PEP-CTERM domain protein n=1 Tax=Nostoc punctiforme NIES-2108 TaxID=1356359 RepID=A0A367RBH5_NOSPU|nr:PEP-CTERM domain protein [Nostoc punctiforme NIES-2108]